MSRLIRYANLKDSDILGKIHSESSKAAFKGIITDYILDEVFSVSRRTKRFITELTEEEIRQAKDKLIKMSNDTVQREKKY
ncbi:hypothetical protein [Clostridium sp. C8-1-8]|uniref:hypothetical protein n=1 Tax=Clostridium sp. C8-1-8 TaxID=2698831 RepID=UPI00136C00FD|nr:hypothetical protein [Clostridium sp. C8-1-8]